MYHGQRRPAKPREERVDVHGRDRERPARAQGRADGPERRGGVGQVLDDVPHRDGVEPSRPGRARPPRRPGAPGPPMRPRATEAAQRDGSTPETVNPASSASTRKVPTWQPTSSSRPIRDEAADVAQALGERGLAAGLLLEVAAVLDGPVRLLHPLVVGPRVHVHEAAVAALDDAPAAAELVGSRGVEALRIARPRERGLEPHVVRVGGAQRAADADIGELRLPRGPLRDSRCLGRAGGGHVGHQGEI